jgi:SpoIID/LytB domain protein
MRASVLVLAAVLATALAPPANAAGWIVRGGGNGHGVGLSQYGAYGLAQRGAGYRRILANYYRGTQIENVGGRTIRVLLRERARSVVVTNAQRIGGRRASPGRRYTVTRLPDRRVTVRTGGRRFGRFAAPLAVENDVAAVVLRGRALNGVTNGAYHGTLEISPAGPRGLAAVNALPVDAYVRGVVAGEMPASWDLEALKAQAVAARTYSQTTDAGGDLFDQYPDQRSQVYRGIAGETSRSDAAVRGTAGEILTYRGRPATTFYSSSSGGQTENVEFGFPGGTPTPYLVSVQDPTDRISPYYRWAVRFTTKQIQRRLRGIVRGRLRGIRVVRHGVSPRVVEAEVRGTKGSRRVGGDVLRGRLELRSTWFRVAKG